MDRGITLAAVLRIDLERIRVEAGDLSGGCSNNQMGGDGDLGQGSSEGSESGWILVLFCKLNQQDFLTIGRWKRKRS